MHGAVRMSNIVNSYRIFITLIDWFLTPLGYIIPDL